MLERLANKEQVSILAKAKINLCLQMIGRRVDGYHLLQSLVAFTNYGDNVSATLSDQLTVTISGPFANNIDPLNNSVLKAAQRLKQLSGDERLGAHLHLEKSLPIAAGIGGGTADAAAALHALTYLWQIQLEDNVLKSLLLELGADVPVCYYGKPCWMEGIGEKITPLTNFPKIDILLVNPGVVVSTPAMFKMLTADDFFVPMTSLPLHFENATHIINQVKNMSNSFQRVACEHMPIIAKTLEAIEKSGSLYTQMSGSGATCLGLFANQEKAKEAKEQLSIVYPDWWVVATQLSDFNKANKSAYLAD